MKKYFIADTDEELKFGDEIEVQFTKNTKHGIHVVDTKFAFCEDLIPLLIEMEAIEERDEEDEENNDLMDFDAGETCEALDELIEDFEALEERIDTLENLTKEIYNLVKTINGENKKPESPKKKK